MPQTGRRNLLFRREPLSLATLLDKYQCSVKPGREPKLEVCPTDDSLFDAEGKVTDPDLDAFLNQIDGFEVYFDECPFDRRLGVVAHVSDGEQIAWYRESECAWVDG